MERNRMERKGTEWNRIDTFTLSSFKCMHIHVNVCWVMMQNAFLQVVKIIETLGWDSRTFPQNMLNIFCLKKIQVTWLLLFSSKVMFDIMLEPIVKEKRFSVYFPYYTLPAFIRRKCPNVIISILLLLYYHNVIYFKQLIILCNI